MISLNCFTMSSLVGVPLVGATAILLSSIPTTVANVVFYGGKSAQVVGVWHLDPFGPCERMAGFYTFLSI